MKILVDLFKIIKLELSEPLFDIRSGKAGNCQCSPSYEDPNGQSECSIENISAIRDVEFIRTNLARKSLKRPTPGWINTSEQDGEFHVGRICEFYVANEGQEFGDGRGFRLGQFNGHRRLWT